MNIFPTVPGAGTPATANGAARPASAGESGSAFGALLGATAGSATAPAPTGVMPIATQAVPADGLALPGGADATVLPSAAQTLQPSKDAMSEQALAVPGKVTAEADQTVVVPQQGAKPQVALPADSPAPAPVKPDATMQAELVAEAGEEILSEDAVLLAQAAPEERPENKTKSAPLPVPVGDAQLAVPAPVAAPQPAAEARMAVAVQQAPVDNPVVDAAAPTPEPSRTAPTPAPVMHGGAGATANAGTQGTVPGNGAESALAAADMPDGLSTPLMSQALPGATAHRTASFDQLYGAAQAQQPHHAVVAARPGQVGRDMGVEIARHMAAGREELIVRMDPAELGRVDVRMTFDRDGGLRALVTADSQVALDMLRREAGDLNRALSEAGVRTDSQSFRFDSRGGEGGQFAQRGQQDGRSGGDGHARGGQGADEDDVPQYQRLMTSGRVDVMA